MLSSGGPHLSAQQLICQNCTSMGTSHETATQRAAGASQTGACRRGRAAPQAARGAASVPGQQLQQQPGQRRWPPMLALAHGRCHWGWWDARAQLAPVAACVRARAGVCAPGAVEYGRACRTVECQHEAGSDPLRMRTIVTWCRSGRCSGRNEIQRAASECKVGMVFI